VKNLALFYALVLLIFMPTQAWAQKKEVYRASNMTVKIDVILGTYDATTGKHVISPPINFGSYRSWFDFSVKVDDMASAPVNAELGDFSTEDFVMVKEYDSEGLITRETVFTPGLIQTNIFEVSFFERLNQADYFFLDMVEMQMNLASFGEYIDYEIKPKKSGIVIQYPISNILPNPVWQLKDSVYVEKMMSHLDFNTQNYYEVFYKDADSIKRVESYTKKEKDVFHIHINVEDEAIPYKVYVDDGGALALKRTSFKRIILDKMDYYTFFSDFFNKQLLKQEAQASEESPVDPVTEE
tara:strand:- start:344078 stop:344968 length:891 start_codon:yes stop_codon:yes gene_type:complete